MTAVSSPEQTPTGRGPVAGFRRFMNWVAPPERRPPLAPFPGWGWFIVQLAFAVVMTVGNWADYENPWLVLLVAAPLSGVIAAAPLSTRLGRTSFGRWSTLGWIGIIAMVGAQVKSPVGELSVLWPVTAATLALALLTMIGWVRWAWAMTLVVIAQGAIWGVGMGLGLATGLEQLSILTAVVGGSVYRMVMKRARAKEVRARQEEAIALEQLGSLASRAEARREYRTRVLGQVGELLDRIERGDELGVIERAECRLVEATLRDAIRGRGLATREVIQAARAARERGANVSLIDDRRTDCTDEVCRNVLGATVQTLRAAKGGDRFVARLLPVGRRNVATVLLVDAEGAGVRREFTMPDSGNPADGAVERPPVNLTA